VTYLPTTYAFSSPAKRRTGQKSESSFGKDCGSDLLGYGIPTTGYNSCFSIDCLASALQKCRGDSSKLGGALNIFREKSSGEVHHDARRGISFQKCYSMLDGSLLCCWDEINDIKQAFCVDREKMVSMALA
jgi:hypothetical protein